MSPHVPTTPDDYPVNPNGTGAAAVLSAGIGALAVASLSIAADKSAALRTLFSIYKPTGALSGVTTGAIIVWLVVWTILGWRWRRRTISMLSINVISLVLLGLSLLLTFPPATDLF